VEVWLKWEALNSDLSTTDNKNPKRHLANVLEGQYGSLLRRSLPLPSLFKKLGKLRQSRKPRPLDLRVL
jgi:hypothetical protein